MPTKQQLAMFAAKMQGKYGEAKIATEPPAVIVPTGVLSLDWALRVGGWQNGRIYEVVGPKDAGKSLTGILAMVQHRKAFPDRAVGYVNIEGTFDPAWAALNGLDCSDAALKAGTWLPMIADTSEEASDMARDAISSGMLSCLVLDSVGGMESAKVLGIEAIKDTMGKNAQVITKLTKALAGLGRKHQCTTILINQPRANMSGFGGDISAGPKAMSHSTTAQIKMSAAGGENDVRTAPYFGESEKIGNRVRAHIPRMKNGAPGRRAEWFIMNRETNTFGPAGVDLADDAVALGVRLKVIEQQGGGYYQLPGGRRVRGRVSVGKLLREDPEAMAAVREALLFDKPVEDPTEQETA